MVEKELSCVVQVSNNLEETPIKTQSMMSNDIIRQLKTTLSDMPNNFFIDLVSRYLDKTDALSFLKYTTSTIRLRGVIDPLLEIMDFDSLAFNGMRKMRLIRTLLTESKEGLDATLTKIKKNHDVYIERELKLSEQSQFWTSYVILLLRLLDTCVVCQTGRLVSPHTIRYIDTDIVNSSVTSAFDKEDRISNDTTKLSEISVEGFHYCKDQLYSAIYAALATLPVKTWL